MGALNCSWVTPLADAFVRIHGTEGQAVIDYNAAPDGLRYKLAEDDDWTDMNIDAPDRFTRQAAHFLDCVEGKSEPLVAGEDGLAVMRAIESAYESAGVAR